MNNIKASINVNFDDNPYEIYIMRGAVNKVGSLLKEKTNNNNVLIIADTFFKDSIVEKIALDLKRDRKSVV